MIQLSDEQKAGLKTMVEVSRNGGLAYQTGEAGSGKSTNLNYYRRLCRKHGKADPIVLAPTGLAATNVGGMTLDRFMGWRPSSTGPRQLTRERRNQVQRAGVIFFDEISMCRADKFDRFNRDLQLTFKNTEPFGGIGVFCIGDHFQLEPVVPGQGVEREYFQRQGYDSPFFFDSNTWKSMDVKVNRLTKIFRQQGDLAFIEALNAVRVNDASGLDYLNERAERLPALGAIRLCFTNDEAKKVNDDYMSRIAGPVTELLGSIDGDLKESDMPSPLRLHLKKGCRVMATANGRHGQDFEEPFINGDLGTVVAFTESGRPVVNFDRGFVFEMDRYTWGCGESIMGEDGNLFSIYDEDSSNEPKFVQFPLKLAYGISVHKSQGMTLDKVHIQIDDARSFAHGLSYVAVTRCKHFHTMSLSRRLTKDDLLVSPRVVGWHQENIACLVA